MSRSIHVLRLTPHFYWPQLADRSWPVKFDAVGGMQTQIYRLAQALSKEGITQTILTLRIPDTPRSWDLDDRCQVRGVRVPVLPLRSRVRGMVDLNLAWALGVLGYILRQRPRVDLVHSHCSGVLWPPLIGLIASRVLNVPLMLTVHCSILVTYHAMNLLDQIIRPISKTVEVRAVRASAKVVVLTPRLREELSGSVSLPAARFAVLPDSIEADAFAEQGTAEATAAFRQRFRLPEDRRVVGYVGRVAHEKGWPILIEAAELLHGEAVHWLICGDGNERRIMEAAIRRAGLGDRFTITGYLPNDQVPSAMRCMDALVLPSIHEEFGGVMLEAMAVGVPTVAFDVGGISHVLDDGHLGRLVPVRTPASLAEAVHEVVSSPAWCARITARAREAVRARYRTGDVAARLADLYREVLP